MSHYVKAAMAALVLATHSPYALGQTEPRDLTAVVAAWNVANGAGSEFRADNVAAGIAWLDAEVIVITEASPESSMEDLVEKLDDLGATYSVEVPHQTSSDKIAVLFKDGVTVTNARLIEGSDDGNRFLRKALAADVQVGEFDFILIGLHLKAGRDTDDREVRTRQVEVVADFIETATAGTEKDVVVIGDYNMIPGDDEENVAALNPDEFLFFMSSL